MEYTREDLREEVTEILDNGLVQIFETVIDYIAFCSTADHFVKYRKVLEKGFSKKTLERFEE